MCGIWEIIAGDVRCVGHLGNKLMALSTVTLCFTSLLFTSFVPLLRFVFAESSDRIHVKCWI